MHPRHSLIDSLKGEKVLSITTLLRRYLKHGLEVKKIHQVLEFTPKACFRGFGEAVSEARRQGDVDATKAVLGDTMKLLGNSAYGKTLMNKEKHLDISICDSVKASKLVNSPHFRRLIDLSDNTYEVSSTKKSICIDQPMQIGIFVYQYAKLRMLEL